MQYSSSLFGAIKNVQINQRKRFLWFQHQLNNEKEVLFAGKVLFTAFHFGGVNFYVSPTYIRVYTRIKKIRSPLQRIYATYLPSMDPTIESLELVVKWLSRRQEIIDLCTGAKLHVGGGKGGCSL